MSDILFYYENPHTWPPNDPGTTIRISEKAYHALVEAAAEHDTTPDKLANEAVLRYVDQVQSLREQKRRLEAPDEFGPLGVSGRAYYALRKEFESIQELLAYPGDPRGIPGLGTKYVDDIAAALYANGYETRGTVWEPYLQSAKRPLSTKDIERVKLDDLGLSVRAHNAVLRAYGTVDAALSTKTDPMSIRNLGIHTAIEIAEALAEHDYDIKETVWEEYLSVNKH